MCSGAKLQLQEDDGDGTLTVQILQSQDGEDIEDADPPAGHSYLHARPAAVRFCFADTSCPVLPSTCSVRTSKQTLTRCWSVTEGTMQRIPSVSTVKSTIHPGTLHGPCLQLHQDHM